MNYFFVQKQFKPGENYSFSHNFTNSLLDDYLNNRLVLPNEEVLQEVFVEASERKDIIEEGRLIFISERVIDVLQHFNRTDIYKFFPVDLIFLQNGSSKTQTLRYYLLQLPSLSFIDYEKSDYKGIKSENYISQINKLAVREEIIEDYAIVRFKELVVYFILSEKLKIELEKLNLIGVEFIPADEFTF